MYRSLSALISRTASLMLLGSAAYASGLSPGAATHVPCFFFQAEGGIRAWSVTGVQTCALPILQAWDLYSTSLALKAGAHEANAAAAPFASNKGSMLGLKAATMAGTILCAEKMWKKNRVGEIGRASCRERVWSWVVGVLCEQMER